MRERRGWSYGEREAIWRRVFHLEERLNEIVYGSRELPKSQVRRGPSADDFGYQNINDEIPF